MKKKLFLIFTVLSALIISACAEDTKDADTGDVPVAIEVWDGTTIVEPVTSSEGVYQIDNASNLAWLNDKSLNKNMVLTNDIDMGDKIFTGIDNIIGDIIIDGNNHTILNLKLIDTVSEHDGVALIQEVGVGAKLTIKNLNLKGGTVNSVDDDTMYGASFVADVFSGDVTLSNVASDLTVYGTDSAGGLIGNVAGASKSIIIEKSMNKGNVSTVGNGSTVSYSGGLIGAVDSSDRSSMIRIDNSSNDGVVALSVDYEGWSSTTGGLIGHIKKIDNVNIITSHNNGDITSTTGSTAGFIGSISASANLVNIDRSYNTGDMQSNSGAAGFIAGNNNTVRTTISNSFNSGDIEGTFGIGGLLGGTSGPEITSSYNSGKVTTKAPVPAYDNSFAGGLIGSVWKSDAIITNSYNIGIIESNSSVTTYNSYSGGLIGKASTLYGAQFNMTITSSYSYGDMKAVTASDQTSVTTPILGIKEEKQTPSLPITITATDNYYYSATGLTNADHAILKTVDDFKNKTTFTENWDFDNVWVIEEGALYPTLKNVVKAK